MFGYQPCRSRQRLTAALFVGICLTCAAEIRAAGPPDLTYVPAEAVAAIVVHPHQMFTAEGSDVLPAEVVTAFGLKELGFDPTQIEDALLLVTPPANGSEASYGVILHFAQPYPKAQMLAKLPKMTDAEESGHKFLKTSSPIPDEPSFYLPDDRTIVYAPEPLLRKMIVAKNVDSPLAKLVQKSDFSSHVTGLLAVEPAREALTKWLTAATAQWPAPLDQLRDLPTKIESVTLRANIGIKLDVDLTVHCPDPVAAENVDQVISQSLAKGRELILAGSQSPTQSEDPVQQAMQQFMTRVTQQLVDLVKPARNGQDLTLSIHTGIGAAGWGGLTAGILAAFRSEPAKSVGSTT